MSAPRITPSNAIAAGGDRAPRADVARVGADLQAAQPELVERPVGEQRDAGRGDALPPAVAVHEVADLAALLLRVDAQAAGPDEAAA